MARTSQLLAILPLTLPLACTHDRGSEDEAAELGSDTGESEGDTGEALRPNWHEDIAPIVHGHCVQCHQDGGIAPMSLADYESAAPWAALALEQIEGKTMPPWGAEITERCQPDHGFSDDPSLSDEQEAAFAAWVELGTPEGDPSDAAPLPEPKMLDLANVSATFQNPSDYEVTGPEDDYMCFSIDLELGATKYLDGVQMLPDNKEVVHHVLVWITDVAPVEHPGPYPCFATPGSVPLDQAKLVSIWVPGSPPTELPEGVSVEVPPGSHVVLAYHYHPPGPGTHVDRSSVALRWRDQPTEWLGEFELLGLQPNQPELITAPFMIPAGAVDHPEIIGEPWTGGEVSVFSVATHMHYVGRDQIIGVQRPGQTPQEAECWIHTPRWDFNWQRFYEIDKPLAELPTLGEGDTVWMDCRYDNVLDNPGVAQSLAEQGLSEPVDVMWGEGTLDEMCVTMLGVAWKP